MQNINDNTSYYYMKERNNFCYEIKYLKMKKIKIYIAALYLRNNNNYMKNIIFHNSNSSRSIVLVEDYCIRFDLKVKIKCVKQKKEAST